MHTDNSKGRTVAPTPKDVETHQQTGGDEQNAPDTQSVPKSVTDHERGSTGKPDSPSPVTRQDDAKPRGNPAYGRGAK
jgi:hypothetical protein